jgi:8-oxo-dGTP diphosphatase
MKPQKTLANKSLADFKVGVDNVIFSVDTQLNRLLVLLIKRREMGNHWKRQPIEF